MLAIAIVGIGFGIEADAGLILISGIERYSFWIKVFGIILASWAFLGVCSSCGGCLIYLFSIASGILCVTFLVLGILSLVYFLIIESEGGDGNTTNQILTRLASWVQTSGSVPIFNETQYLLNCCGFGEYQKTHPNCTILANCRDTLRSDMALIFEVATVLCGVFVVYFVFLVFPACTRMKSFKRFSR